MNLYDNYNNFDSEPSEGEPRQEAGEQNTQQPSYGQPQFSNPGNNTGGAGGGSFNAGPGGSDQGPPRKKTGARTTAIVAVCLAGGLALGGTVGYFSAKDKNQEVVSTELPQETTDEGMAPTNDAEKEGAQSSADANDRAFSIDESTKALNDSGKQGKAATEIYNEVSPSIVTVTSKYTVVQGNRSANATGNGSGIIISDEGYVLTNNHVVSGAESLSITTSDGEEHEAELIGRDSKTDLAVLKFNNDGIKYEAAPLGNSDSVVVGEAVYVIGNPLGELANSMTNGMVSAVNRSVDMQNEERGNVTMNFIQMTAAISPGNSGGALINAYGEVIGVTTAKSYGEAVEGIGYAIPINDAKPIVEDLINNGYVTGRPTIGISGRDISEQEAQLTNIPEGVYVVTVADNSPAAKAKLKVGDVIISVNGEEAKTIEVVNEIKNRYKIGDTLSFEIYRKGEKMTVDLVLGEEQPEEQAASEEQTVEPQYPGEQIDPDEIYGNNEIPEDLQEFFDSIFGYGY